MDEQREPGAGAGAGAGDGEDRGAGGGDALERLWRALGGDPALRRGVEVRGDTGLAGPLPVADLALAAVAAQRLAADELSAGPRSGAGRDAAPLVLDAARVGVAFRSERHLRTDGVPAPAGFAPLSRFWPAADGWVRVHANYPHHRDALVRALGEDPAAAIVGRAAADVEDAVVAAGGVAAAVRTPAQWRAHPAGAAVAAQPVLTLERVADAPARARGLAGLRVLDLTRVIAGPVGTRTLAAHGADVLRLDPPHLPEDRSSLVETGSGKRATHLDLTDRRDRRRVEELLAGADALVHGYRPGALAAHGLDGPELAERHPHLVVVGLSAWGEVGPWAPRRGFDSIVQAASGIAALTAAPDGTPGVLPAQALDHGAGHLVAAAVARGQAEVGAGGGAWHARLSLAQLAHLLLSLPRPADGSGGGAEVDPGPHLVELPSDVGVVTVVRPPASPVWRSGVRLVDPTAGWLPR